MNFNYIFIFDISMFIDSLGRILIIDSVVNFF